LTTSSQLVKSKTQTLAQLKRTSNWKELMNRRIKTCEFIDIGHVIAVDSQSMTILHENTGQEYVIPTYYIREYDQEKVLIDIPIRDLDHYRVEREIFFLICQSCLWSASSLNNRFMTSDYDNSRDNNKCPFCKIGNLESLPLAGNELYKFDYNSKSGVILEFSKKKGD
jgi:hypothetical protein